MIVMATAISRVCQIACVAAGSCSMSAKLLQSDEGEVRVEAVPVGEREPGALDAWPDDHEEVQDRGRHQEDPQPVQVAPVDGALLPGFAGLDGGGLRDLDAGLVQLAHREPTRSIVCVCTVIVDLLGQTDCDVSHR